MREAFTPCIGHACSNAHDLYELAKVHPSDSLVRSSARSQSRASVPEVGRLMVQCTGDVNQIVVVT
jgi:hypothetical protein